MTFDGKISGDMAEKFYQQSRHAEFTLPWQQCIQDEALDYIMIRVKTSHNFTGGLQLPLYLVVCTTFLLSSKCYLTPRLVCIVAKVV